MTANNEDNLTAKKRHAGKAIRVDTVKFSAQTEGLLNPEELAERQAAVGAKRRLSGPLGGAQFSGVQPDISESKIADPPGDER